MVKKVGIKGFSSFADIDSDVQTLEVTFGVVANAEQFAKFQSEFLEELQKFLEERK